jgi:CubicO group peptidase (beta-lactamase class C family)
MMDLFSQMKIVDSLLKFLRGDLQHITPYPFVPQKKENLPQSGSANLLRSTPENEGIPSAYIQHFFEELDACREIRVHSVMLLRHGKIIAEGSFKPYTGSYPHMMFSLSKSVTGMAVGIAVNEGLISLDERIVDIFSDKGVLFRSPKINSITVLHLLNMTSGIKFNEVGSVVEKDWVKAYLQSDCSFEPGSEFYYNSLNSYLLSAIVCKKTGMGLKEYLTPRIFEPLRIENVTWETCPLGIEKGGWGLYLRIADMAKLGQLYLQNGGWNVNGEEKQLIPENWIQESTKMETSTRENDHSDSYGYQIWNFGAENAYQFNGVFGQYVIVLPERDMVVAITSGSQNLFSDQSSTIVKKYFGDDAEPFSDHSLPNNIKALHSLSGTLDRLYAMRETAPKPKQTSYFSQLLDRILHKPRNESLPLFAAEINQTKYRLEPNFGTLMPLLLEGVTNNFSNGIVEAAFEFESDLCKITLSDAVNENVITAGLDGVPRRSSITVNGEVYVVGTTARLTTDEDDRPVLKLFISFIETPSTRIIKFIFYGEKLLLRFDELPSVEAASKMLFGLVGGSGNTIEKMMIDTISQQRLAERVDVLIMPHAKGVRMEKDAPNSKTP